MTQGLLAVLDDIGRYVLFSLRAVLLAFRRPVRLRLWINQMEFIGANSFFIVFLTGTFAGMVFALQSSYAFRLFSAEDLVGSTVALSLTREIGPVFTALIVTGRAGSAMAAELGAMRVTEQIDALETMAVDPVQYLATPRLVASVIMLPALTMVFNAVGTAGAYLVGVHYLGIDAGTTALKAALFDLEGRLLALDRQEYQLLTPAPAWVELDPEVYWKALCRAVRNALGRSRLDQREDLPIADVRAGRAGSRRRR